MSNLDKSLDEILASKPRVNSRRSVSVRKGLAKRATTTKGKLSSRTGLRAGSISKSTERAAPKSAASGFASDPLKNATRILISNLPKDVNERAVRDYLRATVGNVGDVTGSFNSKGQSTGNFTVQFKKAGVAAEAAKKLNGSAIDGGASTLSVSLVFGPNDKAAQTLSDRLALPAATGSKSKRAKTKKASSRTAAASAAQSTASSTAKSGRSKGDKKEGRSRSKRPTAKTADELDAEMVDYFASKDAPIEV